MAPARPAGSFFFSSRRRHTRFDCDWSSDVCSSDLELPRSEDHPPLRLYTAPFQLKTGLSVRMARLPERMQRLGYRPVGGPVAAPGDYVVTPQALTIFQIGRASCRERV